MEKENIHVNITPYEVPVPDSYDEKEVYAFYGLTMYAAQCLEKGLVHLAFSYLLSEKEILTRDEWDNLFADVNKKTFGRLLNIISKTLSAPQSVFDDLKEALNKRNWLAHDYFFEFMKNATANRLYIKYIRKGTDMG